MQIQELLLDEVNPLGSLEATILGNPDSNKTLIFCGGYGDTKETFIDLSRLLLNKYPEISIITFTTRGMEHGEVCRLCQFTNDLESILDSITAEEIVFIGTSDGAFPIANVLKSKHMTKVDRIILLDPADYYSHEKEHDQDFIWSGYVPYDPNRPTSSEYFKSISTNTKVDVINFMIRNYSQDGYPSPPQRGVNHPNLYPRLNNDMVKAFYEHTPEENRGLYIEDHQLPHAFERDGNVAENRKRIVKLIHQCLSSQP